MTQKSRLGLKIIQDRLEMTLQPTEMGVAAGTHKAPLIIDERPAFGLLEANGALSALFLQQLVVAGDGRPIFPLLPPPPLALIILLVHEFDSLSD